MLQRHHHGDGRCGLVGDDGGPLVLRNPRGHAQQGQVRSMAINKGTNSAGGVCGVHGAQMVPFVQFDQAWLNYALSVEIQANLLSTSCDVYFPPMRVGQQNHPSAPAPARLTSFQTRLWPISLKIGLPLNSKKRASPLGGEMDHFK